ncbi:type II toxin-antitoxin system RelB/DinJ family antitoxin [Levilactobacillus wangkuiensis]|uniref:type II toxin-antitoxin system RelB/DinJ family antitoxin n=1 Tax=Levilactobacillus wangkuiensis TaxID=2799566 RepID=UPI0019421E0F|nr:type II toxin-antitoxin system RelB/DinJ family antitoxin [Levilactobacillus wangkuiensis]
MDKQTTLTIRLNQDVKKAALKVVADMGLDIDTVINLFLAELVRTNRLPFNPTGPGFPTIWHDDPREIATFNQSIGLADDGKNYGHELSD